MTTSRLLPQHEQLISESCITPEVANARGYRSVTSKAELRRLRFSQGQQNVPALLIPIHGVAGGIVTYQIRPDRPRIIDGKKVKYETPAKSRIVLDVPPGTLGSLGSPQTPLWVTEGSRKADAAVSNGLTCISLPGVWGWKGRNEHGGKAVLPDWQFIALNGRRVNLAFDSDVMTKAEVYQALVGLREMLTLREADVRIFYLPSGPGGTKMGLDDFFAAGNSVDDLLQHGTTELRRPVDLADHPASNDTYRLTPTGLVWNKPTKDGPTPVQLTNFSAKIKSDILEDDGVEPRRMFEIEAELGGIGRTFIIPVSQFRSMNWPVDHLGAHAIVYPGMGLRDHAQAAIQLLSDNVLSKTIFSHLGWRRIDNRWAYLHAGGAIRSNASAMPVDVRLPKALSGFSIITPGDRSDLRAAIRSSLRILEVGPAQVTMPLYDSIWRASLAPCDFSGHLSGPTGAGKTELAALAQQHWGAGLTSRNLPGSWSSTGNSLEYLASIAKDALLVVDDFAPGGSAKDVGRIHREADRFLRAQGNRSGRQRLGADARLREGRAPAGLALSTGEDVPRGQSLRGRLCVVEIGPDDLDWNLITACQADAAAGMFAKALGGYLQWLAPRLDGIRTQMRTAIPMLREKAALSGQHRRTPGIVAELAFGFQVFLHFATDCGAISPEEAARLWSRNWEALGLVAEAQQQHQASAEPTTRFIELLAAALISGRAHVSDARGDAPESAEKWGWRKDERGGFQSKGDRIGWLLGSDLFLEPEVSYTVVQQIARAQGDELGVASRTLHKRMKEKGLLVSTDVNRKTNTIRKTINGSRRDVLHIGAARLGGQETAQTDQSRNGGVSGQYSWAGSWAVISASQQETDHQTDQELAQQSEASADDSPEAGQIGQLAATPSKRRAAENPLLPEVTRLRVDPRKGITEEYDL